MLVKVEKTAREVKYYPNSAEPVTGIFVQGQWYNFRGDGRDLYNKTVDLTFKGKSCWLTSDNGAAAAPPPRPAPTPPLYTPPQAQDAPTPVELPKVEVHPGPAVHPTPTGKQRVTWADYERMARAAHAVALSLEPDEGGNQSIPRMTFVNTVMIAFVHGDIEAPPMGDDEMPF